MDKISHQKICDNIDDILLDGTKGAQVVLAQIFENGLLSIANQSLSNGALISDTEAYKALDAIGNLPIPLDIVEEGSIVNDSIKGSIVNDSIKGSIVNDSIRSDHSSLYSIRLATPEDHLRAIKDATSIYQIFMLSQSFPKQHGERICEYANRVMEQMNEYSHRYPLANERRKVDDTLPPRRTALKVGVATTAGVVMFGTLGNTIHKVQKSFRDFAGGKINSMQLYLRLIPQVILQVGESSLTSFLAIKGIDKLHEIDRKELESTPEYQAYLDKVFQQLPEIFDKLLENIEPHVAELHEKFEHVKIQRESISR